jgi:DNA-binding XRE family transcriptional regulator
METLNKIQNKVNEIAKGYTCDFNYKNTGMHHINGANHLCFSIEGEKIKFHSVGGSRFFYTDMKIDQFIEKLPSMLLTIEEINNQYKAIASKLSDNQRGTKKFNPEIATTSRNLIGEAFRNRREELGMLQVQLAECTGLMQRAISNFESGKENITLNSLIALAGCLRMEIQFNKKDPDSVPGIDPVSPN